MINADNYIPSERQMDILELVYKFRFINRRQIQYLMGHKDARRINAWLKDLIEHKYLGRIYSHKLLENTKPAIYFLDNRGVGWTIANYYEDEPKKAKRFYQDKHASERFVNHCVTLAEIYVKWKPQELKKDETHFFTTSTELWYEEELKNIRPDAHIETWRDELKTYFLDLIEPYVPMYAVRYKIDQYIEFRSISDEFAPFINFPENTLTVRLILPTQQKLNRIKRYIQRRLEESYDVEGLTFFLATQQKILENELTDDVWEEVREE